MSYRIKVNYHITNITARITAELEVIESDAGKTLDVLAHHNCKLRPSEASRSSRLHIGPFDTPDEASQAAKSILDEAQDYITLLRTGQSPRSMIVII